MLQKVEWSVARAALSLNERSHPFRSFRISISNVAKRFLRWRTIIPNHHYQAWKSGEDVGAMKAFPAIRRNRHSRSLQIQTAVILSQIMKIDKQKLSILGLYNSVAFYVFRSQSFEKPFIYTVVIVAIQSCIFHLPIVE